MDLSHITACHECDLLLPRGPIPTGYRPVCPRCGSPMAEDKPDTVNRTLAMVIAGLLLFWPANFLPILSLNIMDKTSAHTMIGAVEVLYRGGMPLVAAMVMFCSLVAPFLDFFLLFVVLVQMRAQRYVISPHLLFRMYNHIGSWVMLEVYMIGLLVSIIKLLDMARVEANLGLVCFVGMMLANLGSKVVLDKHKVWEQIETLCKK